MEQCFNELGGKGLVSRSFIVSFFHSGGGKDVAVLTGQKYKNSYTGCIANVHVEDKVILLQDMAEDGRSVHPCTENSI